MEGTANAAVISALESINGDLMATLSSVAPIAIGIMGIFLAWQYGKRLFKSVAK